MPPATKKTKIEDPMAVQAEDLVMKNFPFLCNEFGLVDFKNSQTIISKEQIITFFFSLALHSLIVLCQVDGDILKISWGDWAQAFTSLGCDNNVEVITTILCQAISNQRQVSGQCIKLEFTSNEVYAIHRAVGWLLYEKHRPWDHTAFLNCKDNILFLQLRENNQIQKIRAAIDNFQPNLNPPQVLINVLESDKEFELFESCKNVFEAEELGTLFNDPEARCEYLSKVFLTPQDKSTFVCATCIPAQKWLELYLLDWQTEENIIRNAKQLRVFLERTLTTRSTVVQMAMLVIISHMRNQLDLSFKTSRTMEWKWQLNFDIMKKIKERVFEPDFEIIQFELLAGVKSQDYSLAVTINSLSNQSIPGPSTAISSIGNEAYGVLNVYNCNQNSTQLALTSTYSNNATIVESHATSGHSINQASQNNAGERLLNFSPASFEKVFLMDTESVSDSGFVMSQERIAGTTWAASATTSKVPTVKKNFFNESNISEIIDVAEKLYGKNARTVPTYWNGQNGKGKVELSVNRESMTLNNIEIVAERVLKARDHFKFIRADDEEKEADAFIFGGRLLFEYVFTETDIYSPKASKTTRLIPKLPEHNEDVLYKILDIARGISLIGEETQPKTRRLMEKYYLNTKLVVEHRYKLRKDRAEKEKAKMDIELKQEKQERKKGKIPK